MDSKYLEQWDGYFYLFLRIGKDPQTSAELADDALEEWRARHYPHTGEEFGEYRNADSSVPPKGSIFFTKLKDNKLISSCCGAEVVQDPTGTYENFPICSKCKKPAGV